MPGNLKRDYRRGASKYKSRSALSRAFNCLWSPGFQAVLAYRICRWLVLRHIPLLHILIQRGAELLTGISIPPTAQIGSGLLIEHFGGIVINSRTRIGENCTISHGVTIGNKQPGGKAPVIGDNVYVCVDAKILGDITVGNNCIIGANAVLMESVPDNSVVAGMPGRVVKTITNLEDYQDFFNGCKK